MEWILANQLGRRNLTAEQKSYLRGKRYQQEKKKEGGQAKNKNAAKQLPHNEGVDSGGTAERLAAEYQVSTATIERDAEFAEALDTLEAEVRADLREVVLTRAALDVGIIHIPHCG